MAKQREVVSQMWRVKVVQLASRRIKKNTLHLRVEGGAWAKQNLIQLTDR